MEFSLRNSGISISSVLDLRSVIITPHRSNTFFNLVNSISLSVFPDLDDIGMIASFTESWITRDWFVQGVPLLGVNKKYGFERHLPRHLRIGHYLQTLRHRFSLRKCLQRRLQQPCSWDLKVREHLIRSKLGNSSHFVWSLFMHLVLTSCQLSLPLL